MISLMFPKGAINCIFLGLFVILPIVHCMGDPNKQAQKALQKGDYLKAQELLQKSLSKDSLNPAAYFLSAQLHSIDSFPIFNLDTGYYFIRKGIQQLESANDDIVSGIAKLGLALSAFQDLKLQIEFDAYQLAYKKENILALETFMNQYENPVLLKKAERDRDSLAYLGARKINSWQAYKNFMQRYPNAKQFNDAKGSYDWLLFKDKTAGNALSDLESFVSEYPESPYLDRVVKDIHIQYTVDGSPQSFAKFLDRYSRFESARKARNFLFHLVDDINNSPYSKYVLNDSLQTALKLSESIWLPYFERGKFGFKDLQGTIQITPG